MSAPMVLYPQTNELLFGVYTGHHKTVLCGKAAGSVKSQPYRRSAQDRYPSTGSMGAAVICSSRIFY